MASSLYKIAEQVCEITGRYGDIQAVISSVVDSYSSQVKKEFYENRADGCQEVDGIFLYTFGKTELLTPSVELSTDMYYIVIPSSFLRLPHEMGINAVSFIKGQTSSFVRVGAGGLDMWSRLKSNIFGGRQTYYVEGTQMYFPKMTSLTNGNILLKLAIALDAVDVDEELNIPRSVIDNIVMAVVAKFQSKPPVADKVII
jgi:hypothetical protein